MPDFLKATIKRVIKPPHLVTVEVTKTTKVFENGELIDTKVETPTSRNEWRVVVVVEEEYNNAEKEKTLSRSSQEEALGLVEGAVAYHF